VIQLKEKLSKMKSWEKITVKLMDKIIDMVNQSVQDALKKLLDTKNKNNEKTQKQLNEVRGNFNKRQSETKDTMKRER
jgi:hypothetical protein